MYIVFVESDDDHAQMASRSGQARTERQHEQHCSVLHYNPWGSASCLCTYMRTVHLSPAIACRYTSSVLEMNGPMALWLRIYSTDPDDNIENLHSLWSVLMTSLSSCEIDCHSTLALSARFVAAGTSGARARPARG
jgi:hypothetical protein